MAAVSPPAYIQASSHPADVFRRALQTVLRGGYGVVNAATDLQVSANGTPNMSVNVAAGMAVLPGSQNPLYQGVYAGALNDAVSNLTIASADQTNPRIDLVVAQVEDAAYSGSNNDWKPAVIAGAPAASPSPPAAPANSITLAQVRVNAGVSSIVSGNITDTRPTLASTALLMGQAVGAGGNGGGLGQFLANSRFLGMLTAPGAPTTGTYVTGDWGLDSNGAMFACVAGGAPGTWRYVGGGPYQAYAYAGHNQGCNAAGSSVLINVDTIDFDPNGNFNTATHLYTCPVPGTYHVDFEMEVDVNCTLLASIHQAGSRAMVYLGSAVFCQTGNAPSSNGAALVKCAAGDTIGLYCEYTSIATANVSRVAWPGRNFLSVKLVGS